MRKVELQIFTRFEDVTRDSVEAYIMEAAETDRGMTDQEYQWLYKNNISWPLIKKDEGEKFANAVANGGKWQEIKTFMPPLKEAIERYMTVMDWLKYIDGKNAPRDRRIVFYGARSKIVTNSSQLNIPFVKRYAGTGLHRATLHKTYNKSLDKIVRGLLNKINKLDGYGKII